MAKVVAVGKCVLATNAALPNLWANFYAPRVVRFAQTAAIRGRRCRTNNRPIRPVALASLLDPIALDWLARLSTIPVVLHGG